MIDNIPANALTMYRTAKKHEDRYLLSQREHKERGTIYKTAEWLVDKGYATWITSHFAPGIQLTGKPLETKAGTVHQV